MITNTKQNWTVGNTVKVGFMSLTVLALIPTPGDYAPDAYLLSSKSSFYRFVPHNGLVKLEQDEVVALIEQAKLINEQRVKAALNKSAAEVAHVHAVKAVLDWSVVA